MALIELDGAASGSSSVSGEAGTIILVSGNEQGVGQLIDDTLGLLSGTALGSASVSGDVLRIRQFSGVTLGTSSFALSIPEPVHGFGTITAFMDVVHVPPPLCPPVPFESFRWQQMFQKGDLCFNITDNVCNPVDPVFIEYTLYQVVRGCQLQQIGCKSHTPARCKVGTYYVTGCAGDGGQPGTWLVRWRYQKTFADPIIETDQCYQVLDAVSGPIPGDSLDRHCKFGWD